MVTAIGGISLPSSADHYTYLQPPTVTGISLASGPAAGGATVTITGTGFTGASEVTFGSTDATDLHVVDDTTITATSPAGTGTVDVTVTSVGGISATSSADQYTYIPAPTVTGVLPTYGPAAGGTSLTITGTGFTDASAVTFGGTAAATFTVDSETQITATSPAGTGTVDVTVTTIGGTSAVSPADQFTFIGEPVVTGLSPTSGPVAGGTSVTISGSNFGGVSEVDFGTFPASILTVSDTEITVTSPGQVAPGMQDVRVVGQYSTSAIVPADQFTYT
jgi:hypothetical protein